MFEVGSQVRWDRAPGLFTVAARNTNDQGATYYDLRDEAGEVTNNVAENQLLPGPTTGAGGVELLPAGE